jgi:Fe-S oxidoreductase
MLPQLAAPGVDVGLVKREIGWNCNFGPVYAKDISEYAANGFKKTNNMRYVKWPLIDRLDVGLGVTSPILLIILVIMAIFLRAWLVEFVVLGWGLVLLMYGFYPLIPGKVGWPKLLFLEGLIGIGLLGYVFLWAGQATYIRDLFSMAMGLVLIIGADSAGATPLEKAEIEALLDKLSIRRIGPVSFSGRAKIIGSKVILDQTKCTACGICYDVCPRGVYEITSMSTSGS